MLLTFLVSLIIQLIQRSGYLGITLLMVLESANFPIPSEVIMPLGGFLVAQAKLSFWLVVFSGAFGNLFGSCVGYSLGYFGGRPFISKYGKYLFLRKHDLDLSEKWFLRYGNLTVFFARLLPIVRTFISTPAGVAKMNFKKFCLYTFLGSLPWSWFLVFLGKRAGENWQSLETYFKKFDWLILVLLIALIFFWIKNHLKH